MTAVANHAPAYLIAHFFWTYALTSTRPLKNAWKIDHNVSPREDIVKYGEKAVESGKISRGQLNMLKRNEAAHHNTIEHLPFFIGSVLFATVANVPNESINRTCLIYTVARVLYHIFYLFIEKSTFTPLRSAAWWTGNITCLTLLWQCKTALG